MSKPFGNELPDLAVDVTVKIGDVEREFTLYDPDCDGEVPCSVAELALLLERKLRALPDAPGQHAYAGVEVTAFGRRLQVVAGSTDPEDVVRFLGQCANDLGLEASVNPPVFPLEGGEDGEAPGPRDLIGSEAAKTGIQALRGVADVNLLALPELAAYEKTEDMLTVVSAAQRLCEERRIFLLVDAPGTWVSVDTARAGLAAFDAVRGSHAGLYFPHIQLTDPLHDGRLRAFPPSRRRRRLFARTDATRGVWKAPAGHGGAVSRASTALSVDLTDGENGVLNPLGVNCLRTFPVVGPRRLGRAHAATAPTARRRVEVRPGAAARALPRGEPLPRHAVGRVRAERRAALGADPAQRRRVHAQPVPPGRLPGHDAARGVLRQVRHARRRRRTTSTSASSTSWSGFAPLQAGRVRDHQDPADRRPDPRR